jgi:acetyl-CoA acyltransferase
VRDVVVVGTGMTRFGKFPERSVRSMAEECVAEALADSGVAAAEVGFVAFANAAGGILQGQEMIRGHSALHRTGLLGVPIVDVENACASASSAFHVAWLAVASGSVDIALAVGAEKLTHPEKIRSLAAIGTALDLEDFPEAQRLLSAVLLGWHPPAAAPAAEEIGTTPDVGRSGDGTATAGRMDHSAFMDVYAKMTETYLARSGGTVRDLAGVSVKNRRHAAANEKAQYRQPVTVQEVLSSRMVSTPLTTLMCSPIADGAAALVLASTGAARKLGVSAIRVRASTLLSGRDRALDDESVAQRAALRSYDTAGVGPEDLDVVELHDAAATAELLLYEELGLCPAGEGPKLLASGDTALGGRIPVNPSGGLLSRGHPIGATGCGQLVELADQLRGRCASRQVPGAHVGLAENGGGFIGSDAAATVVTILSS